MFSCRVLPRLSMNAHRKVQLAQFYFQSNPKFAELYVYLGQVAPFGSPTETVSSRLKSLTSSRKIAYQPGQKVTDLLSFDAFLHSGQFEFSETNLNTVFQQPAWKPSHFKGKAALHFDIKETIRAVQVDFTVPTAEF